MAAKQIQKKKDQLSAGEKAFNQLEPKEKTKIRQSTAFKKLGENRNYFQHIIPELISTNVKQLSKNEGF